MRFSAPGALVDPPFGERNPARRSSPELEQALPTLRFPAAALPPLPRGTPVTRDARGVGVVCGELVYISLKIDAPVVRDRSIGEGFDVPPSTAAAAVAADAAAGRGAVDPRFKKEATKDAAAAPVDISPPLPLPPLLSLQPVGPVRGVVIAATATCALFAGSSAVSRMSLPRRSSPTVENPLPVSPSGTGINCVAAGDGVITGAICSWSRCNDMGADTVATGITGTSFPPAAVVCLPEADTGDGPAVEPPPRADSEEDAAIADAVAVAVAGGVAV